MADRDIFPVVRDSRRTFRLRPNRNVELTIQNELEEIEKKSLRGILSNREQKKKELMSEEYKITRTLVPHFKQERVKMKRKTEPMFPGDVQNVKSEVKKIELIDSCDLLAPCPTPSPHGVNVLSVAPPVGPNLKSTKTTQPPDIPYTRKYPFCKPETIKTTDMNKPHRTSMGVLPLNRDGGEIPELKVVMEGKPVCATTDALDDISMANRCDSQTLSSYTPEPTPTPMVQVPPLQLNQVVVPDDPIQSKPAILGQTGTTLPITFSQRQKPQAKPMTRLKANKKLLESIGERTRSAKSLQSSLMSGDITLPDQTSFSQYDQAIEEMDDDLENVTTAVSEEFIQSRPVSGGPARPSTETSRPNTSGSFMSAKALLEEAKRLTSPKTQKTEDNQKIADSDKTALPGRSLKKGTRSERFHRSKEAIKGDKSKTKSLTSYNDDETETLSSRPRSEWTVDEIITSLRIQSRTGEMTDADRRIQEIMDQVLSRTSTYLDASDSRSISDVQDGPVAIETEGDKDEEEDRDTVDVETADTDESTTVLCTEIDLDPAALPEVPPPVVDNATENGSAREPLPRDLSDIQQAWADLLAPPNATYEDIVKLSGTAAEIAPRQAPHPDTGERIPVYSAAVSFLSSWAPTEKKFSKLDPPEKVFPEKTIHHFCTATTEYQLPKELQGIGRKYHTPGKYEKFPSQPYRFSEQPLSSVLSGVKSSDEIPSTTGIILTEDEEERRQEAAAERILAEAYTLMEDGEESLEAWQQRADQMFTPCDISVEGRKMAIKTDDSRLFWTPAPPRLDVPPAKVRQKLFPLYEGHPIDEESEVSQEEVESSDDSEDEELENVYYVNPEDMANRDRCRTLARQYTSHEDLTEYVRAVRARDQGGEDKPVDQQEGATETEEEPRQTPLSEDARSTSTDERARTVTDMNRFYAETAPSSLTDRPVQPGADGILPVFPPIRRSKSVTRLFDPSEDALIIPNDFTEALEEMKKMKEKIQDLKTKKKPKTTFAEEPETFEGGYGESYSTEVMDEEDQTQLPRVDILSLEKRYQKEAKLTPAELALQAGRAYVVLPKKKKKKVEPVDMNRVEAVQNFLSQPPNRLKRSISRPKLTRIIERELRVPYHVRSERRASLPTALDFERFAFQKGKGPDADTREWVRDVWNMWFDQVFPPSPDHSDEEDEEGSQNIDVLANSTSQPPAEDKAKNKETAPSISLEELESVDCLDDSEENQEVREILLEEVARLTEVIESMDKPRAFDIGRRGAIYRKLGKLKKASDDINRAIQMEPLLLDAYWHRHLVSLVLGKKQAALDDLTFILKHNKNHAGAYRSMAEVFRDQGEITMSIVNYTQAIKLNPEDHEAYIRRAEMYEKRGEMRLALEDYAKATKLQPTKTDAIFKHGMYHFNNENWNSAINDFTDMLKVEPTNSQARMLRGQAFAKQGQWNSAVADLSGAIHMDPNNWQAYYHRGCILRRAHPQRALQDFSMSLLIEDSVENIMTYLHRGILYNAMDKPEDAIPDFEALLKLDNDISVAHINLGLIYMKKFEDYSRAIKKFTAAIKVDPTCVRAIVCRAECYHKIRDLKNALKDFTRAIHLHPDVHHYYMHRGQIVLQQGNLELAAFCVRHASELSGDERMVENATQQAVVQSFLRNYDKAVDVLMAETRIRPVAPVFMLLGKTQMKAKTFKDATESFERALALYKPWSKYDSWPIAAAETYYLIGMCHTELRMYNSALEAFNNAIRIDNHYAEAFYRRGLTRIRLKQAKGIQDFNRALALNPKLFQVFLSRACYYGMKGKHAKAILNCNEALKLQPRSVRAYLYRGALKYHIKAYELAIRDLTFALAIDSTCSLAYFNRAVCYQENKQYEKALTDYGIVLLLGDDLSIKVLINRGLLYFERGDYTNALYDFKTAGKLHPWNCNIHHSLGLCYHKLNQLQLSVVAFTKSLTENPFFLNALVARGNVYMDYGHKAGLNQARSDYQRALVLNPNFLPARVNLAYSLQVHGSFMQAWRQFTAAIAINPKYQPALEGRAIVNLQMSDKFAAFQDISAAINVSPSAELYTNRGVINQFMKDGVNAMKDYHLALKKDPTYALAYFNAANIYFHTRHFKQALDYYSKAVQYNPRDESAYLNRAITRVMQRDATGALEDFKVAIRLSPYSAHIYFNRGNLYASTQKYDKAEADYNKALSLKPDDPLVLKRRADVRGKLGKKKEAFADYRWAVAIQSQLSGD
ncbi:LOW QUALITY PROTEIN: uncharacterized protein LOC135473473 [Liolophura sinensis]|uniref:LOW QUALITY PROTEIN: uncharacterized protein LOC135473473 n=1 Tax=Liolophura sinensis TaxID=3198878 RepID=UPI0031589182